MRLHFLILFLIYFIIIQQITCDQDDLNDQIGQSSEVIDDDALRTTSPIASTTTHHHKNRKQRIKTGKKHKIIHRKIQNFRPHLTTKQIGDHPKESTEFIFTKNNNNPYAYQDTEEVNDQNANSDMDESTLVKATDLTVKVGDTAYLKCAINSTYGSNPGVIWMQGKLGSVLTLNTNRITVDTRFEIVQLPLDSQQEIENNLLNTNNNNKRDGQVPLLVQSQLPEMSYYHLKIVNVQLFDENEYACETSITKNNDDQPSLHSLIRLHVTQSPNFIESLTSESNLGIMENADAVLKCFAIGKPAPKIRWYRIEDNNGLIRDLNHESTSLTLKNITKHENSKYECIAENGILPSVSKKFSLTVYYMPILKPIRKVVIQNIGQRVLLGCAFKSNPESTLAWYKSTLKPNITLSSTHEPMTRSSDDFIRIDSSELKYQIHTFKQINQTVSYLKIKDIEESDYLTYKCEATNVAGKSEAFIDLLGHHHAHNYHNKHHTRIDNKNSQIKVYNSESIDDEYFKSQYEDSYDYTDKFNGRHLHLNHNSNNRTASKHHYQTNKSSRVAESLEGLNDYVSSQSNKASYELRTGFSILAFLVMSYGLNF